MLEIRFHGRGGQGAVVASRLLAEAAFLEGNFVQAFPTFGLERRGAPVMAFTRIQDSQIRNHSQIYTPDTVVVLDASLLNLVNVCEGLKVSGIIIVNSALSPDEFPCLKEVEAATVSASAIAMKHGLGSRTYPIVNTAILGAVARITRYVAIESVIRAIKKNVSLRANANVEACLEAFDSVRISNKKNQTAN